MYVTPVYAALLTLLFVILSVRTLRTRRRLGIAVGDGANDEMLRAMRVHANFAEYAPLSLLVLLMLELQGAAAGLVHGLGALLLVGRCVHAWGVSRTDENYRFRVLGMSLTFTALLGGALGIAVLTLAG